MNRLSVLVVLVVVMLLAVPGAAFAGPSPRSAGAPDAPLLLEWTQRNAGGFGNKDNAAVSALEVFGGQLYAGATNDQGAQIWRTADGANWSPVPWPATFTSFGHGVTFDMIVFNGQLYVGIGTWYDLGSTGQIWRTADGATWQLVTGAWSQNVHNAGVNNFAIFGGALYATVNNPAEGIEIYRSTTGNPNDWVRVANASFGLKGAYGLSTGLIAFNNALYVVLEGYKGGEGARVYRSFDGVNWMPANAPGFGDSDNFGSGGFAVHRGFIYVGTWNDVAGGQIWRSPDGTSWAQVGTSGFGTAGNYKIQGLVSVMGTLFAFADNNDTGAQVWSSTHGLAWERSNIAGFGSANNKAIALWSNGAGFLASQLFLGTFNQQTGGQVWSATPPLLPPLNHRHYLPFTTLG